MTAPTTAGESLSIAQICGEPLLVVELTRAQALATAPTAIVAGVVRASRLPEVDPAHYDLLLTTVPDAPRPWVALAEDEIGAAVAALSAAARRRPLASRILAQTLRIGEASSFEDALRVESLAYSTLLGGSEFRAWRAAHGAHAAASPAAARLRMTRDGDELTLRLCNAQRHNAFDAQLRDELLEALAVAAADPQLSVALRADGANFCSGSDLAEFGAATDLALAHAIRTQYSVARAVHALRDRCTSYVHGGCIGAGIEIPAAARIVADATAMFRLPEVAMGLIPGAGGTVTLPRRIGRHRCLYWALLDLTVDRARALEWGLVDAAGDAC